MAVRKKALRLVPVLASLGPLNRPLMEAVFQRFADTEDSTKVGLVDIFFTAFHVAHSSLFAPL